MFDRILNNPLNVLHFLLFHRKRTAGSNPFRRARSDFTDKILPYSQHQGKFGSISYRRNSTFIKWCRTYDGTWGTRPDWVSNGNFGNRNGNRRKCTIKPQKISTIFNYWQKYKKDTWNPFKFHHENTTKYRYWSFCAFGFSFSGFSFAGEYSFCILIQTNINT